MKEYYKQENTSGLNMIERGDNGLYFVHFGIEANDKGGSTGGPFQNIEDARATLHRLRPGTIPINPMCNACTRCNADCNGTACQVWTGCIYRARA